MSGNAIAYLRISSDPSDERLGVERQRADVRALAERLDTTLIELFEDNDVSAFKKRKTSSGWGRALSYISEHRPEYLLVYKQDRVGRRLADIEGLEELCRRTGTRVVSTVEGDVFQNPAWPLLAAVARMESQNISTRVQRAHQTRREAGLVVNGGNHRPYAYKKDRFTLVKSEAVVLRDIAARVMRGETMTSIVKMLNREQIPTVMSRHWTVSTLRYILTNPRYVGELTRGRTREVVGKAAWEPVFDRATWEALQVALTAAKGRERGRPALSLLGGIARCGRCLAPMGRSSGGRGGKRVYRCQVQRGGCGRLSRQEMGVDAFVVERLMAQFDADVLAKERDLAKADVARLTRRDRDLTWRLLDARTAYQEDRLDSADAFPILDALRRDQTKVQSELAAARLRQEEAERSSVAQDRWNTWTRQQQRAWIKARVQAVIIRPATPGARTVKETDIEILPK
jgi:site-specific DNA recombinase